MLPNMLINVFFKSSVVCISDQLGIFAFSSPFFSVLIHLLELKKPSIKRRSGEKKKHFTASLKCDAAHQSPKNTAGGWSNAITVCPLFKCNSMQPFQWMEEKQTVFHLFVAIFKLNIIPSFSLQLSNLLKEVRKLQLFCKTQAEDVGWHSGFSSFIEDITLESFWSYGDCARVCLIWFWMRNRAKVMWLGRSHRIEFWHNVILTQGVSFPLQMTRLLTVSWNRQRERDEETCAWDKAGSDLKPGKKKCLQNGEKHLCDQRVVSELLHVWNFITNLFFCQSAEGVIRMKEFILHCLC